ncbi:hypothetical protein TNCV_95391 [Trichonephila clavipes]|nr:hypothetical protein TNCV_95391 [Trichonephila clavipes]
MDHMARKTTACREMAIPAPIRKSAVAMRVTNPFRNMIPTVLDESRSFFRVHTGYFSNIPKCIKAEFIASWACSQSSVVSSSQR